MPDKTGPAGEYASGPGSPDGRIGNIYLAGLNS